jgi:hypothetical protein
LAQKFKLQIRSQNEREAKDKLETFDFWYRHSNLDVLLSSRLAAKEQKKAGKEKNSRASGVGVSLTARVYHTTFANFNGFSGQKGEGCP